MKKWNSRLWVFLASCSFFITGCSQGLQTTDTKNNTSSAANTMAESDDEKLKIGLAWETFVLERWIRDRDVFVSTASEEAAEINVQNANGNQEKQVDQINYLIEKGMDVIAIVAVDKNSKELQDVIAKAKRSGIKIIAYDRMINDADLDLYISFDNEKVGELMAKAVLEQIPPNGRIAEIMGSPTDANVEEVEKGIQRILEEQGQKLVYQNYAEGWNSDYGYEYMEDCLEQVGEVDGVICGNDGLAANAFRALSERQLADKVCLVGQDADIDACQRIVEGQQYMTVYKDLQALAKQAAQYAVALGKGKGINPPDSISNGSYEVPSYLFEPVAVTKENMEEEIINSQFHQRAEVYLKQTE